MCLHRRFFSIFMTYSIHLSGVVFFVAADAYVALKAYLHSLHQYFVKIEDGQEILIDLQTRMAEILLEKDKKEVITFVDITMLINTIGNVNDFEEAENNPAYQMTYEREKKELIQIDKENQLSKIISFLKEKNTVNAIAPTDEEKIGYKKKLFRDNKRKKIAGVIAGISYFFSVNPLWLRLIYLLLFFFDASVSTIFYIASWILMPTNDHLPEQEAIKNIYRNSEKGIIAGVCKGLSEYFGIEEKYCRMIFIASNLFFGLGFIFYILLWALMPINDKNTNKNQESESTMGLEKIQSILEQYYKK